MAYTAITASSMGSSSQVNDNIQWAAYEAHPSKPNVRAASTANGTLASAFEAGDTLDGVTLAAGDRILLKDQTTATENGIYTVASSGAPTRASDAASDDNFANGVEVYVEEGTANGGKKYKLATTGAIAVGTTALSFTELSGGGGSTPTGTGIPHIVSGVPQGAASLIVDADVSATAAIAESKLALASDAAAGTASRRTLGTGAQQAAAGNHTHSSATTSAAGMMSAADKLKLDNATDANTASTLVKRDSSGNFKASDPVVDSDVATKAYADSLVSSGAADASDTTKGITQLSVAPDSPTAPIAVGDNDSRVSVMGASGTGHSAGIVDDPGATAGSTRYWREDAVWANPTTGFEEVAEYQILSEEAGTAITAGVKAALHFPYACTIVEVTLLAPAQTGSIVVDLLLDTYANFPPTDADSITASTPPTITSGQKAQDSTLASWTTSIPANSAMIIKVPSDATTIENCTVSIKTARV